MPSLETTQDDETWSIWLKRAGVDDVYYSARYARIWARETGGQFVGIRYEAPLGSLLYPLLLVPLDALPGGVGLSEARTPYDFGGPLGQGDDLEALHRDFRLAVLEWFESRCVVSEFTRIHPLSRGGRPSDAKLHAENFVVDLSVPYDDLLSSQHGRHRRGVRTFARERGRVDVIADISPDDAASFAELYGLTMDRVGAGSDYYFTRETLSALMALDEMSLARAADGEGQIRGAALFLRSGSNLFYFLGGSANDRMPGANNAIFDATIRHAQSEHLTTLHLGGGSESLREFKSQISSGTVPYYVLQRIVDERAYSALCEASGVSKATQFPAFRSMLVDRRQR